MMACSFSGKRSRISAAKESALAYASASTVGEVRNMDRAFFAFNFMAQTLKVAPTPPGTYSNIWAIRLFDALCNLAVYECE